MIVLVRAYWEHELIAIGFCHLIVEDTCTQISKYLKWSSQTTLSKLLISLEIVNVHKMLTESAQRQKIANS